MGLDFDRLSAEELLAAESAILTMEAEKGTFLNAFRLEHNSLSNIDL